MKLKCIEAGVPRQEAGDFHAETAEHWLERIQEKLSDEGVRRMEAAAMQECRRMYEGSLFDWNDIWGLTDMKLCIWKEIEPDIPFWVKFKMCVGKGVWNELTEVARRLNGAAGHEE